MAHSVNSREISAGREGAQDAAGVCASPSRHDDQVRYYAHFSPRPEEIPHKLSQATVTVVGAGGIGSEIIRHLAVAGVGSVVCVDADTISPANLNRQHWFEPSDIGKPKTERIAERMRWFAPQTAVIPVQRYINSPKVLVDAIGTLRS